MGMSRSDGRQKKNEKKITEANNVCEVRCGSGQAWQCLEMCAGVSVSIHVCMSLSIMHICTYIRKRAHTNPRAHTHAHL